MLPNPNPDLLAELHGLIGRRRARWVVTLHDETLLARFAAWPPARRQAFDEYLGRTDHVLCIGARLRQFLAGRGMPADRVTAIAPLLPPPCGRVPVLPAEDRRFLAAHRPTITTIGVFDRNCDVPTVARAFPRLLARHPHAGLLVIDPGFTADPDVRREVTEALREAPAASCRLVSGIPRERVRQLLAESAVFVRGTRHESFGLSRVEALLGGTPVVSSASGETRHMRLYEYGSAEALAEVVLDVLASPPDLTDGRAYYARLAEETLETICGVYAQVARTRARGPAAAGETAAR
jgi:glycosyltransferase involved in cell wall biosynthesis